MSEPSSAPWAGHEPAEATSAGGLRVLVIDDERPALDELAWLLGQDRRIAAVQTCDSATGALRILQEQDVDAVFLDIQMPGLTGLELAQVLTRFRQPPPIVFVTAHDEHAVEAFDLRAVDYVLKPVRGERLAEAVRRVVEGSGLPNQPREEQVPVERAGVTRFVDRSDITHVEAQGDYARLHTATGSHLVRAPLTTLEKEWAAAGFVRIHRSLLVNLGHVREVRMDAGRCTVTVGPTDRAGEGTGGRAGSGTELQVSRRHTRELREVLLKRGRGT